MKYTTLLILILISTLGWAQNKTDIPTTYSELCFYTIEKATFDKFLAVKKAIDREEYAPVYAAIRKMRTSLKGFTTTNHNRAFELWYIGNYTDFEEQAMVAKESTLANLKNYEHRLRLRDALYYDHRLFLEQYLAFETEAFYKDYWFMSQERYFSRDVVNRILAMNKEEGEKLFTNSEFYRPFDIFNEMAKDEEAEIKDYLDIEEMLKDSSTFIPYSYMVLDKSTASYILQTFVLDDATQDIDMDRQVRALKRFLMNTKSNKIYLVARFNHIELRRIKALEAQKKRQEDAVKTD